MKIRIVSRPPAEESPLHWLAGELREKGVSVELTSEQALDRSQSADALLWEYPGGEIVPATLEDADEYAALFAKLITPLPAGRIMLVNSPRNRDSIIVPSRLGLAGSIDKHDLWVAASPGMLNEQSWYESGIVGRTEILTALGCEPAYEDGFYAKVPVKPFTSLAELVTAYLERYLPSL